MDEITNKAYELTQIHRRITPALLMRVMQINGDMAYKMCLKIWLRQHVEARKYVREMAM